LNKDSQKDMYRHFFETDESIYVNFHDEIPELVQTYITIYTQTKTCNI
jgi:hypothetical protein